MVIGEFTASADGYSGRLQSLLLNAELTIVPAQASTTQNAPDWRIFRTGDAHGAEVGAGWNRTGRGGRAYIALQIDDPSFARSLRANLVRSAQDERSYQLLWSRRPLRDVKQS